MWTSGDAGFEVAMKDGNKAMCCSEGGDSADEAGGSYGIIPDDIEGDGDGGSCTLLADEALPLDLWVSSARRLSAGQTNLCRA